MKVFIFFTLMIMSIASFGAVQTASVVKIKGVEEKSMLVTWAAMLTGNTGSPIENPSYKVRSVQVTGTFGGATIAMEGSNDGVNWSTLNDNAMVPFNVSFTSAGIRSISQITRYIRPNVTGGSGAAIDVNLVLIK